MKGKSRAGGAFSMYVCSWDTAAAGASLLAALFLVPESLDTSFLQALFSVSVGALSIIFAVYFAALTTITASGNDEFISFLDLRGHLRKILAAFRTALLALFLSLLYSLTMFASMAFLVREQAEIGRWPLVVFSPLASYSLVAAYLVAIDAVKFARERAHYFRMDEDDRRCHLEDLRRDSHTEDRSETQRRQTAQDRDDG